MNGTAQQHNRQDAGTGNAPRDYAAVLAAVAELVAHSDALDQAVNMGRSIGRAMARAEDHAELAELREQVRRARDEGYAEAVADIKRVQHGIVDAVRLVAEAERGRWVVRGEMRTRATFGAPHKDDYTGGPVAWAPGWAPGSGDAPPGLGNGGSGPLGCAA